MIATDAVAEFGLGKVNREQTSANTKIWNKSDLGFESRFSD